jgi:hypothetical protein
VAILKYLSSISNPINFLFVIKQATAVVPLPENASKIVSPSQELFLIILIINSIGF